MFQFSSQQFLFSSLTTLLVSLQLIYSFSNISFLPLRFPYMGLGKFLSSSELCWVASSPSSAIFLFRFWAEASKMKFYATDGFNSALSRLVILLLHVIFDSICLEVGREGIPRGKEKYFLPFSDFGKKSSSGWKHFACSSHFLKMVGCFSFFSLSTSHNKEI